MLVISTKKLLTGNANAIMNMSCGESISDNNSSNNNSSNKNFNILINNNLNNSINNNRNINNNNLNSINNNGISNINNNSSIKQQQHIQMTNSAQIHLNIFVPFQSFWNIFLFSVIGI